MARKQEQFKAGSSQMFCVLTPPTSRAEPQLWAYTTFSTRPDAEAYLAQRCDTFGRDLAGHTFVPCTVTIRI